MHSNHLYIKRLVEKGLMMGLIRFLLGLSLQEKRYEVKASGRTNGVDGTLALGKNKAKSN